MTTRDSLEWKADDGAMLHVHRWRPEGAPCAAVQIAHGMAEHGARYARFAERLAGEGFLVWADDHRGHGHTARSEAEVGHMGDADSFVRLVRDMLGLRAALAAEAGAVPVALFAHSMGSLAAQEALIHHGPCPWKAVVLSGSDAPGGALVSAGKQAARLERLRQGPRGKSALLASLSFGSFNKAFKPARTPFDWLSRDPAEVDKYVADPRCGFRITNQSWVDLLVVLEGIGKDRYGTILPKDLPILAIAGARDPVGKNGEGVRELVRRLRAGGLSAVREKIYADARHELLNETNRDEVMDEVLAFLREALGLAA